MPTPATPTKVSFTIQQLLAQAKADLWAKEVQTGYTPTYSWMANQLGHIAIGFIGVALLNWLVNTSIHAVNFILSHLNHPSIQAPWPLYSTLTLSALGIVYMAIKEFGDYLDAKQDWLNAGATFPFDRRDVILDSLTAVLFMWSGAALGILALLYATTRPYLPFAAFVAILTLFLLIGRYWLTRKKCFQQAGTPFLFRLANFELTRDPRDYPIEQLEDFLHFEGNWQHLLVTGPPASGKTTLLSALAAEITFDLYKARYTTFAELLEDATPNKQINTHTDHPANSASPTWLRWTVAESAVIFIDAVESGAVLPPFVTPEDILRAFQQIPSLRALASQRTVWAIGLSPHSADIGQWFTALAKALNTPPESIGHFNLE